MFGIYNVAVSSLQFVFNFVHMMLYDLTLPIGYYNGVYITSNWFNVLWRIYIVFVFVWLLRRWTNKNGGSK